MSSWKTLTENRLSDNQRLPRLRSGYLIRDDFKLPDGDGPTTIGVFAPPGFGKTQLLAYWFYHLRERGHDVRWVDGALPDAALALKAYRSLSTACAEPLGPRALFVDNCDSPEIATLVASLAERRQANEIVAVAGRKDYFPGHHHDRVIPQDQLRLDEGQATALLRHRLPTLGSERIDEIVRHCEGVPALLNLAVADLDDASAIRRPTRPGEGSLFVAHARNCIASLSPDDLSVLRDIAVPDSFSIELAETLAGRRDCAVTLERLMQALPFFLPLPDDRQSLLPAFRNILLRDGNKARIQSLHGQAARWFADRQSYSEAIDNAIAADDIAFAMDLMSENLLEIVIAGELERALGWLAAIPRDQLTRSPDACLAAAFCYLVAGQSEPTGWFMARLTPDQQTIVLASHFSLTEQYDEIERLLEQVESLESLTPVVAACYGNLCRSARQRSGAAPRLDPTANTPPLAAEHLRFVRAIGLLLETEKLLMQGEAEHAITTLDRLTQDYEARLGRSSSVTHLLIVSLASACFQAGEFDRARGLLLDRLDALCQHNMPAVACTALLTAARLEAQRGHMAACLDLLERLETCGIERDVVRLRALAQAERVRIYAVTRQQMLASVTLISLEKTQKTVQETAPSHQKCVDLELALAQAYFLRSLGKTKELAAAIERIEHLATLLDHKLALAEAVLLRHDGQSCEAVDRDLDRLAIGAADRRSLLARMAVSSADLSAQANQERDDERPGFDILGRPVLIQMTSREVHILEGLAKELSNKAIARELRLSTETVKWYIARILPKLGARDRRQAVDRARVFGVLPLSYGRSARPATTANAPGQR